MLFRSLSFQFTAIGIRFFSHKIRKLVRRCLSLCDLYFLPKTHADMDFVDFLNVISDSIFMSLASLFPEREKMKDEISDILAYEVERYLALKKHKAAAAHHQMLPRLLTLDFPALVRLKGIEIEAVRNKGCIDGATANRW